MAKKEFQIRFKKKSAPGAAVGVPQPRPGEVAPDDLLSAPEVDLTAGFASLGHDPVDKPGREFEFERGLRPGEVLDAGLLVIGEELHDLDGGDPHVVEFLKDKVVEDQPGEVAPLDQILAIALSVVALFKGTPAEWAPSFHQFIQVYLFPAGGTSGMGCMHS